MFTRLGTNSYSGTWPIGNKCIACGNVSEVTVVLPYGSDYDEEHLCADCIRAFVDPAIEVRKNGVLLKPGSLKAIAWEMRNGDVFTVVDEILHRFQFLMNFDWRFNYCQWAHLRKKATQQARAGDVATPLRCR